MGKTRLEAFSDGVIAIIITIMVLDLRIPHGNALAALIPLFPVFVVLLMCAMAYWWLQRTIIRVQGPKSSLAVAVGRDTKGKLSPLVYAIAIPCAFVEPLIAGALYALVAMMWLIPDRRIEARVSNKRSGA